MRTRIIVVASLALATLLAAPPAFGRGAAKATQDKGLMKKSEEAPPQGPVIKQQERDRPIGLPSSPLEVPSMRPATSRHDRLKLYQLIPTIESYTFQPGYVGGVLYATDPGVIAPGGKLRVKIKDGVQGVSDWFIRVTSPEFANSYLHLADTRWIGNDTAEGTIPSDLVTPLHRVNADVFLWRPDSKTSAPHGALFEVPSETRFIGEEDVTVENCGKSDADICIDQDRAGSCGVVQAAPAFYGVGPDAGIHASHKACWSVGANTFRDSDRYRIQLANGWVFSKLDGIDRMGTSAREEIEGPTPDLPVGGTQWRPRMEWFVTDNDHLSYWMRIEIKGPKGKPHR